MGQNWIHPVFKWLWRSSCQHKHKVFFWLLAQDRLSTRNILRRRNMQLQSFDFVLCLDSHEETVEHLFLHCQFAKACWNLVGVQVPSLMDPLQVLESFKSQLKVSFFMEIIVLMCWSIWSVRNNLIFRGEATSLDGCKRCFKEVFGLVILHTKKKHFPLIVS